MGQEDTLRGINNLVLSACGTSLYASEYGALLMRHLRSFDTVQVVDAAECNFDMFPLKDGGLCVLSQSGETKDVIRVLDRAELLGKTPKLMTLSFQAFEILFQRIIV